MKLNRSSLLPIFLALVLVLPGCAGAGVLRHLLEGRRDKQQPAQEAVAEGVERHTLQVGGVSRSYLLYTPRRTASGPMPLVMVFHGGGGNADQIMPMSGWNEEAEKRGWLVAYPNGTGKQENKFLTWNAGECCGYAQENGIDDVAFVRAMLDDIGRRQRMDNARIYATGISNGAMLNYRLACELSDRIAAIAPISGTQEVAACHPAKPISIMHFHGTADQNVPFEGGYGDRARIKIDKRSIPSTLDEWRSHDQCRPAEKTRVDGDATFLTAACTSQAEIILVKIDGGGHAWPGGKTATRSGQTSSRYIDATQEMARFFERHTR